VCPVLVYGLCGWLLLLLEITHLLVVVTLLAVAVAVVAAVVLCLAHKMMCSITDGVVWSRGCVCVCVSVVQQRACECEK
jgi:hypothetical protein